MPSSVVGVRCVWLLDFGWFLVNISGVNFYIFLLFILFKWPKIDWNFISYFLVSPLIFDKMFNKTWRQINFLSFFFFFQFNWKEIRNQIKFPWICSLFFITMNAGKCYELIYILENVIKGRMKWNWATRNTMKALKCSPLCLLVICSGRKMLMKFKESVNKQILIVIFMVN